MTMSGACRNVWRGGVIGLLPVVLVSTLPACFPSDREPVSDPIVEYEAPQRSVEDGIEVVRNSGPRERLLVRDRLPSGPARVLFMDGRATTTIAEGEAVWADLEGGRMIHFDGSGAVLDILQADGVEPAPEPVVAWRRENRFMAFERDGGRLTFNGDGGISHHPAVLPAPVTGADAEQLAASRSPLFLPLAPVLADAPLLWLASDPSGPVRPMGTVRRPDEPLLGYLVNSGWALPAPDGGAYFASALRPELLRLDPDGSVRWRSEWRPDRPLTEPAIEAVDGTARARFDILQHALTRGPDGRLYVLAASDGSVGADRLLVFEEDGVLVRTGRIAEGETVLVDDRGAVHVVPEDRALMDPAERERRPFQPFELPGLEDERWVDLDDHQDRVVVLNFWASWCPPCRREIPALDALVAEMDPERVVVIGLNDDRAPRRGAEFLEELGGVSYPNAAGEGELRRIYGYRGLPYTVILDRNHRVVRSFYGFGGSLDPIRDAVREVLGNLDDAPMDSDR